VLGLFLFFFLGVVSRFFFSLFSALAETIDVCAGHGLIRNTRQSAVREGGVGRSVAALSPPAHVAASDSDQASVVFVPKTLFCNHELVLASDAARREIASVPSDAPTPRWRGLAAGLRRDTPGSLARAAASRACLFDTAMDRDLAGGSENDAGAANNRRIFLGRCA